MSISHVYIINIPESNNDSINDSINDINEDLKHNKIKATPWKLNKKSADIFFNDHASMLCRLTCPDKSKDIWISHYSLWQYVVQNKLDKVLVLENNTILTKNFSSKLKNLWKSVPKKWDVVLLGCGGTCEMNSTGCALAKSVLRRVNTTINENVFRPAFPTGLYAYMISYKGAKKLLEHDAFSTVGFNLELTFAQEIADDGDFNIYTFSTPLVFPTVDRWANDTLNIHQLFDPVTSRIELSSQSSLQTVLNTKTLNYKPLNTPITNFTIIIIILSLVFGLFGSDTVRSNFIPVLFVLEILELAYMPTNSSSKYKVRSIFLEFVLATVMFLIGVKVRDRLHKI